MTKKNYIKKDNGELGGSYASPTKNKDIPKPSDVNEEAMWASVEEEESVSRVWEAFQNNSKVMLMKNNGTHENTTTLATPDCMVCGEGGFVEVPTSQYEARQNGAMIQEAFPDMPAPLREQILTGTHPACWDKMFAGMEDEED